MFQKEPDTYADRKILNQNRTLEFCYNSTFIIKQIWVGSTS